MKILIVSQYYWPEDFAAGVYVPELAERLVTFGHDVTVLTGPPNYPAGRVHDGYNRPFKIEHRNGVRIIRVWFVPSARSSGAFRRGLTAVTYALGAMPASLAVRERPDVILGLSPPIFMGAAALLLARRWRIPWLLNVKDLFTESVIASGLATGGMLTSALRGFEHAVYRRASYIVTNAQVFVDYLTRHLADRVSVIPDWADGEFIRPLPAENAVRAEWGLTGAFVVLYSGSLGFSSDLETVIDAAALLRDLPDLQFVIVGDGVKRESLESRAAALGLDNVRFFPLQPRDRLPDVLSAADVALVTLSTSGGRVSTQGKLYSLLAAGRPIVAVVPHDNDVRRIIEAGACGWSVDSGKPDVLAALIRTIQRDRGILQGLGKSARTQFEAEYSLEICAHRFEERLRALVPLAPTPGLVTRSIGS